MVGGSNETAGIHVVFPATWDFIEPLRLYVEVFAKWGHPQVVDRVTVVLQELVENAVKYGSPSSLLSVDVTVDRAGGHRFIEVRVSNEANPSRVAVLKKEFERLASSSGQDAFARALDRLRKLPSGSSMLGLARAAAEAPLSLDIEGDRVTIVARVT